MSIEKWHVSIRADVKIRRGVLLENDNKTPFEIADWVEIARAMRAKPLHLNDWQITHLALMCSANFPHEITIWVQEIDIRGSFSVPSCAFALMRCAEGFCAVGVNEQYRKFLFARSDVYTGLGDKIISVLTKAILQRIKRLSSEAWRHE
ncbi:hypothetical protein FBQ95_16945 [Chloroflexi bacterium CFX3]|nr:hypothetical protein [Chloroflexi bacterium CFX3]